MGVAKRSTWSLSIVAFCVAGSVSSPSSGQSLVENAYFNTELQPWVEDYGFNGTAEWNSLDRNEEVDSGSVLLTDNSQDFFSRGTWVGQVGFSIQGGAYYVFGASAFVPSGQPAGGVVRVSLILFSQMSSYCDGPVLYEAVDSERKTGEWVDFVESIHAPINATCARMYLVSAPDGVGNPFQTYVDSAVLREALFADDFEWGNTSEWSGAVLSLPQ